MKQQNYKPRKDLTGLLIACLILVVFIEFGARYDPLVVSSRTATKVADILSSLSLAYVASYIFHIIGDLWTRREQHESLQWHIEDNILGLFGAYKLLVKGMGTDLNRSFHRDVDFADTDDLFLSYEWDSWLASEGEAAHVSAQRMFRHTYFLFMEHYTELESVKEHLTGNVLVQLNELVDKLSRIKTALDRPVQSELGWHMNHVGDKINDFHAELSLFKILLASTWPAMHPTFRSFLGVGANK